MELQSDIRKWFMKSHDKGNNAAASKPSNQPKPSSDKPQPEKNVSVLLLYVLYYFICCDFFFHFLYANITVRFDVRL